MRPLGISASTIIVATSLLLFTALPLSIIMATLRVPSLRHVVSGAAPYLRATQRRWAQVHDVRFLATQSGDRIIEKYKEKLDRKAKQ